jgi:hypothetical protein
VSAEVSGDLNPTPPPASAGGVAAAGVYINGDLVVNSPKADASTMMNTTKRTLRNIGTQVVL